MTATGAMQNNKAMSPSNQDQRPREPSMEDILASIRRIIADDQSQAGRGLNSLRRSMPPAISAPPVQDAEPSNLAIETDHHDAYDEVLDLARMPETVVSETLRQPSPVMVETPEPAQSSHDLYADEPEPAAPAHAAPEPSLNGYAALLDKDVRPAPPKSDASPLPRVPSENLFSSSLARHFEPSAEVAEPLVSPKMGASVMSAFETLAATVVLQNNDMLDRVMRDLMRPLLKTWLDENLPTLVERLVRVEIERMARGGRG